MSNLDKTLNTALEPSVPSESASTAKPKRKRIEKSGITRPKQKYDLVEVWWDDASGLPAGWDDKPPVIEHQMCLSVGFLLAETAEHIVICMDLDASGNHNGRSQIPIGMVKYRRILKQRDKAKKG